MNMCDQLLCLCAQEGNTFCSQLDPKLFNNDSNHIEHKVFFKCAYKRNHFDLSTQATQTSMTMKRQPHQELFA